MRDDVVAILTILAGLFLAVVIYTVVVINFTIFKPSAIEKYEETKE